MLLLDVDVEEELRAEDAAFVRTRAEGSIDGGRTFRAGTFRSVKDSWLFQSAAGKDMTYDPLGLI